MQVEHVEGGARRAGAFELDRGVLAASPLAARGS
jgi:hypothetical protein